MPDRFFANPSGSGDDYATRAALTNQSNYAETGDGIGVIFPISDARKPFQSAEDKQ